MLAMAAPAHADGGKARRRIAALSSLSGALPPRAPKPLLALRRVAQRVVRHEDYADKSLVSLRDTLVFSPGVYVQPRYGQEVRISVRGSGLSRGFPRLGAPYLIVAAEAFSRAAIDVAISPLPELIQRDR